MDGRRPGPAGAAGLTELSRLVVRSRTQLFLQYRNQAGSRHGRGRVGGGSTAGRDYGDHERLVESPEGIAMADVAASEPRWMAVRRDAEEKMDAIEDKLKSLKALISDATLLGFDDDSDVKQRKIEAVADEISALFHVAQGLIRNIKPETKASQEENKARQNAQIALAARLQGLSTVFRKAQSGYLNRLQGVENRVRAVGAFDVEPETQGQFDLEDKGFTEEQLQELENNLAIVDEREREIAKIAKSIADLAMIFRDMQQMVIDQGTILDQIEHNMEMVVSHVEEGKKEVIKADEYQKSYRNKLCVLFLIIIVVALVIALSFKPR